MSVDRKELRRLSEMRWPAVEGHVETVADALPDLLDEIDAKDRRIAELEAHQELYIKELEVARSLTDPQVAAHFHKERYELMGQLAILKLLVRKITNPPFATNAPLTDDEIRELLRAHGCDVQW